MGCGMSTEDKEGKARNEEIENQLKRDKMLQRNEIKMLLLGMLHCARADRDGVGVLDPADRPLQVPESRASRQFSNR